MTLLGLCGQVQSVRASELLDYTDYEGDYEVEMGIGHPPEFKALLEYPDLLVMAWGPTVPMIATAVGTPPRTGSPAPVATCTGWLSPVPRRSRRRPRSTSPTARAVPRR
jgi:4-hydroxy-tetrahydrodipicolinate reductase